MKSNLNISIPVPCTENWTNFSPSTNGRYCSTCSKTVVDFTQMNDQEVLNYFNAKPSHTCGRLRADQLKIYSTHPVTKSNSASALMKMGFVGLLLLLLNKPAQAQMNLSSADIEMVQHEASGFTSHESTVFMISGKVVDDSGAPLPGCSIVLKGTNYGTVTNGDGTFSFPHELKEGDILIFSFIGYQSKEYVVTGAISDLVIKMDIVELMGAVAVDDVYHSKNERSGFWSKLKSLF